MFVLRGPQGYEVTGPRGQEIVTLVAHYVVPANMASGLPDRETKTKSVDGDLEAKARAIAGWKGYTTNLANATTKFVISSYHKLWHIEKSFRMSKHDLQARPIYHHTRDSIEAHLSIVVAAMAVSHFIETQTNWSIKKFVRTARRYRTVQIKAGRQILTAADPLPDDLRDALAKISTRLEH